MPEQERFLNLECDECGVMDKIEDTEEYRERYLRHYWCRECYYAPLSTHSLSRY